MATSLFILIVLSGYHYFMQTVVIPTWQAELKMRLYRAESHLRDIVKRQPKRIANDIVAELGLMMSRTRETLPYHNLINFVLLVSRSRMNDQESDIEQRSSLSTKILDGHDTELKGIYMEYISVVKRTFLVNSGGWLLYVLPFFIIKRIWDFIANACREAYGQTILTIEVLKMTDTKIREYQEVDHLQDRKQLEIVKDNAKSKRSRELAY